MMKFLYRVIVIPVIFSLGIWSASFAADGMIWKTTIISALAARPGVPAGFCSQFSPDSYTQSMEKLTQEGARAQNGFVIKYRNMNRQEKNRLYFTEIHATISRSLDNGRIWTSSMYIHLQQLSASGVADGVWSTPDCKGRLIAQPQ